MVFLFRCGCILLCSGCVTVLWPGVLRPESFTSFDVRSVLLSACDCGILEGVFISFLPNDAMEETAAIALADFEVVLVSTAFGGVVGTS